MVLQFAIDDSETKPAGLVVMGGLLSTAERWAKFATEWDAALKKRPAVSTGEFSWSEAARLEGGFADFTESQRDARVLSLTRIIRRYAMFRGHTGIRHESWKRVRAIPAVERAQKTDLPNPLLIVMCCRMAVIGAQRLGLTESCDIYFDQSSYEEELRYDWPRVLEIIRKECAAEQMHCVLDAPPTYRSPKRFSPIQAADLYAGALRTGLESGKNPGKVLRLLFDVPGLDYAYLHRRVDTVVDRLTKSGETIRALDPFVQLHPFDEQNAAAIRKRRRRQLRASSGERP
jgi:hypothetical protein